LEPICRRSDDGIGRAAWSHPEDADRGSNRLDPREARHQRGGARYDRHQRRHYCRRTKLLAVCRKLNTKESVLRRNGYQGQVGSKPPELLKQQLLPNFVIEPVKATRNMLFIKLPDRIVLIDPDSKVVA
jgi:hypothetical protein